MSEEGTKPVGTAEQLRAIGQTYKRRFRLVELPVAGVTVRIRSLTEREMSVYQAAAWDSKGNAIPSRMRDAPRRLMVACLVDDQGNRLLSDADVGMFSDWDAADTQALFTACYQHVGLSKEDAEGLLKNSEGTAAAA